MDYRKLAEQMRDAGSETNALMYDSMADWCEDYEGAARQYDERRVDHGFVPEYHGSRESSNETAEQQAPTSAGAESRSGTWSSPWATLPDTATPTAHIDTDGV